MSDDDATPAMRHALAIRLAIGLAQGLALYGLYRWREELIPAVHGALFLTAALVPIVALGAIGAARRRTAIAWLAAASLITLVIGGYALYAFPPSDPELWLPPATGLFTAVAIFILHHLILPADAEGRWRAGYARYFDEGWKDAVRLGLAVGFVGALWILLWLGATLFQLIGLQFLEKLITKPWFAFPATTIFFATSVHITDVRVGLVRGARTLALTLLSWLLPVLTLIAVGFLAALPFTGLKPLLATRTSSGVMLAACAALIILINATYQDGEHDGFPPRVLKWAARIAAAALAPLALVAAYGVWLRIGEHGLTPERIYAAACVVVAACYAAGYLWAAVSRGGWMKRLETANWITAQVAVVLLLALFSPLLDPARMSVASQVHRLQSGRVAPARFDFVFLRWGSGRWGQAALKRLATDRNPEVAQMAQNLMKTTRRYEAPAATPTQVARSIHAIGPPLPADFLGQAWPPGSDPAANCAENGVAASQPRVLCQALTAELDGRPGPEIVVFSPTIDRVFSKRDGRWVEIGQLSGAHCPGDLAAVAAGRVKITPPEPRADVEVDGRRMVLSPDEKCPLVVGKTAQPGEDVTEVTIVKRVPAPR